MAKRGKRYQAIRALVQPGKLYPVDEALRILKESSKVKFIESVDVAIRLGIDPKKSDQQVRGATVLPAGTGKRVRVAVFARRARGPSRPLRLALMWSAWKTLPSACRAVTSISTWSSPPLMPCEWWANSDRCLARVDSCPIRRWVR